ncbi:MAG TPA: hypothetical protein EYM78_03070 [Gemmatimonadetes bacterium]|nr:hypothetical protein [Gemmatimonadota bacterium]HIN49682.1 hypothetical protein [Gemmatimonadota bacterium]
MPLELATRYHDMRTARACLHQIGAAPLPRGWEAGGCCGRARHGNRGMGACARHIRTGHGDEHRTVRHLSPCAVRLGGPDHGRLRITVGRGSPEAPVLRNAVEVRQVGALHGKRPATTLRGPVVTNQLVGTLLEGLVCVVGIPLDDRGAFPCPCRRRRQRHVDRALRLCARCDREQAGDGKDEALHCVPPLVRLIHALNRPENTPATLGGSTVGGHESTVKAQGASTRTAQVGPLMRRRAGGRMKNSMRASLPGATGVVAAAGSALCCAGPVLAVTVGVSGAGLSAFEPLRPYFLGATAFFLVLGFVLLD